MNTAILLNFLRHLLFLLIIFKIVGIAASIITLTDCVNIFHQHDLLPMNMLAPRQSIFIATHNFEFFPKLIWILLIVTCIVAFIGAIYIHSYPLINFVAGMNFLLAALLEITAGITISHFVNTFDILIIQRLTEIFDVSNVLNGFIALLFKRIMGLINLSDLEISFSFSLDNSGWLQYANGSQENHSNVDYVQRNLKCCGLTGRQYWMIRIPESCCSEEFPGKSCTLSVAYSRSCIFYYETYKSCLLTGQTEFFIFGLVGLAAGVTSLYLARIKAKHSDDNYDSESSTSTESVDEH